MLIGGGVSESARGLLCVEGAGELAGEMASGAARAKLFLTFSSSDGVPTPTSLSKDDKNEGASCSRGRDEELGSAAPSAGAGAGTGAAAALELDASPRAGRNLLVLGRLSLRSGSWFGSTGDAVPARRLRLFWLGAGPSAMRARSSAPHDMSSSLVS